MARRVKKPDKTDGKTKTIPYVTVAMVRDEDEAKEYQALLASNNIPVTIKEHDGSEESTEGFEVLVPEDCLDEAFVVIESSEAYEDFYDLTMEEDQEEFNDDLFDEDF